MKPFNLAHHIVDRIEIAGTWAPGATDGKFGHKVETAADLPTEPEIGYYFHMTQSVEPTGPLGSVYKIGIGGSVVSTANAPELYGMNPVVDGKAGPGHGVLQCVEADVNNRGADAVDVGGANGAYGFTAAGGGSAMGTAGFYSAGFWDIPKWTTGFYAGGYTRDASFRSNTNARSALEVLGAHSYGIEMLNPAALSAAMALKNNLPIMGMNNLGALVNMLMIDTAGLLQLGSPNVGYIMVKQSLVPSVDNAYQIGTGSLRWGQIYSGTGTISTSDVALKDDVAPLGLAAARALLDGVTPISYRFKVGRNTVETIEEDGEVEEAYLFETGQDQRGRPIHEWRKRMVPGKVTREVVTPIPGKRTHFGFDAGEVKAALDGLGIDGGLYVHDADTDMLRMEQFTPLLWVLVKDLAARVASLEGTKP